MGRITHKTASDENANVSAETENTTDTEGGNETDADAAARAEFDAAADASRDLFYATFTVPVATVLNSPAREKLGEQTEISVTRMRKGSYVASYHSEGMEPVIGREGRNPNVAVKRCVEALGVRLVEVAFDAEAAEKEQAPIPENAGDNSAQTVWFFDEESEISSRLRKVEGRIREADELLKGAVKNTRSGWRTFGAAYNEAKAIFAEAGLSADTGDEAARNRGWAAWGTWLRARFAGSENVEAILAKKNAAAQAGFFATAPEEVIDAAGVNAASTFMRKAEEAAREIGLAVAESVLANRRANDDDDKTLIASDAWAETAAKIKYREDGYAAALAKWQKEAAKAAEALKTPAVFADAKKKGPLMMARWLFDQAETGENFYASKLGKAVAKAWEDTVNQPSAEEKAEAEATKATAAITKRFADMPSDDAARHLLKILVAHPAPEVVLEQLGDMLVDWHAEQEAKARAAKEEAEKAATEAAA